MAQVEEKKHLINVESNLDDYVKDLQKANDEVEKFKIAQKEAEKQSGKNSKEYIEATAQLKVAQKEQSQATATLTKMTTAQKANGTSYNDLHKQWVAAELALKRLEGTIVRNADGTITLSEAYKKAKIEATNAKDAVDKFNLGANNGTSSVGQYAKGLQGLVAQSGTLGGVLSGLFAGKGGISIAAGFAAAGVAITGLYQGLKAAIQYTVQFEKSLSNLKALTGASADDIRFYRQAAKELGDQFGKTGKDMVETFKIIGSAKPELLKNKEGLVAVSEAATALSFAAGVEVPEAANSLVLAMNQFGAPASEANRYINAMAAGAKEGAAEIPDLSDSLVKFGSVAAALNIPIEQSVGLIEALAEKGIKAEQAGTGLKSFLLKLEQGAKDTRPSVVGLEKALSNLKDKNMSVNEAQKMFGLETANVALALISQSDRVKELTKAVTGTNEAFIQAAINQDNVSGAADKLGAKWTNMIDTLLNSKGGLSSFFKGLLYDMSQVLDGFTEMLKSSREQQLDNLNRESKETIDMYKKFWEADKNMLTLKQDMAEFTNNQSQWESRLAIAKKKMDQDEIDKSSEKIKMYKSLIELAKTESKARATKPKASVVGGEDTSKATKSAAKAASDAWTKYYNDRKALLDAEKILAEGQYTRMAKSINDLSALELERVGLTANQRYLLETQKNKALSDLYKQYIFDKKKSDEEYAEFQKTINSEIEASDKESYAKLLDQQKTDGQARVEVARINADNEYAVNEQAYQDDEALALESQQARLETLRNILDDENAAFIQSNEYYKLSADQRALYDAQYAAQRIAISNQIVNNEIATDKLLAEQKKKTFAATADLLGATSELVGKETAAGKSMAIAQAVINTYLAASNALVNAKGNPILAAIQVAAAVATGIAQVKQIMAVKVSKNASNNVSGGGGGSAGRTVSASFTAANQDIATSRTQQSAGERLGGIQQNANNQAAATSAAQQPIRVESVISVEAFQSQAEKKNQVEVRSNI